MSDYDENSFESDTESEEEKSQSSSSSNNSSKPSEKQVTVAPAAAPTVTPAPVPAPVPAAFPTDGGGDGGGGGGGSARPSLTPEGLSEVAAGALRSGVWRAQKDPTSGKTYYYNTLTKKTTWDLNRELEGSSSEGTRSPYLARASTAYSEETSYTDDRKHAALWARENTEYQALDGFTAFGSRPSSVARSSVAPGDGRASAVIFPGSGGGGLGGGGGGLGDSASAHSPSPHSPGPMPPAPPGILSPPSIGAKNKSKDKGGSNGDTGKSPTERQESGQRNASSSSNSNINSDENESQGPAPAAMERRRQGLPPQLSLGGGAAAATKTGGEAGSSAGSGDPSSIFSTLSQHLRAGPPPVSPGAQTASYLLSQPQPSLPLPVSPSNANGSASPPPLAAPSVPSPLSVGSGAAGGQPPQPDAAPASHPTVPAPLTIQLPSFPTSGLAPPSPKREEEEAAAAATTARGSADGSPPPPLLRRDADPHTERRRDSQPPPEDPKLAELRETSEAVERLVNAFARLRGYDPTPRPPPHAQGPPSDYETASLGDARAHRVGAPTTVSAATARRRPAGPAPPPPLSPSAVAELTREEARRRAGPAAVAGARATAANEALLEDALLECIVGMLAAERGGGANAVAVASGNSGSGQRTAGVASAAPPPRRYERVSAEDFKYFNDTRARRAAAGYPRAGPSPLSLFDGELRTFADDGDGDAAASLFDAIQESLDRYVFSRVAGSGCRAPPGTAPVAPEYVWALLLDVLSACREVRDALPADGTAGAPAAVLRYEGDPAQESLARAALHCLPFEALRAEGRTPTPSLFRLEFWVTRAAMRTVLDAVTHALRRHVVAHARGAGCAPFTAGADPLADVPASGLVPPDRRLLRLLTPAAAAAHARAPAPGESAAADGGMQRYVRRSQRGEEDERETFGVPPEALSRLALAASGVATDALARRRTAGGAADSAAAPPGDAYEEAAAAAAETVAELLDDAAVRAAVERRTAEKLEQRARERAAASRARTPAAAAAARERAMIDKVEAEAEAVVQRILQEMRVQSSRGD